jgi:hypothetical protein
MVRIHFDLRPSDTFVGETMWGEKVAERRYRLRNIPFFAYGVSEQDIVFADRVRGILTFAGVSLHAGHSTYRILKARDVDAASFDRLWIELKALGCAGEGNGDALIAMDVPPHADIRKVHDLLVRGEETRVWEFEEGHCAHGHDAAS